MATKVLVVEDDRKMADLVRLYLQRDGYTVFVTHDGREGLELARKWRPDLLILDLMLPRMDGLDICRILRAESSLPTIILTARSTEDDRLLGLDLGADDYVVKPFSPRELVARVRAVLRRVGPQAAEPARPARLSYGELVIDFHQHLIWLSGQPVNVTPKEFKLLEVLALEPGRAFSRIELLEKAFGMDYEGLERTIDVHVYNLRKKLEIDPEKPVYVQTVFGKGYKFVGGSQPIGDMVSARG